MIFDTHAHYDDERFDEDRDALLRSMKDAGIGNIVNIGANMASSKRSLDLAAEYDFMYAAVGVHPSDCAELDDEKIEKLKEMSSFPKCVAIGEIGLDYYYGKEFEKEQRDALHWQLDYAKERDLPVNIHLRDAMGDFLEILRSHKGLRGNMHAYSGSYESFMELQRLGDWSIGVGGVVTFKKASLAEVVAKVPLERIVLETDAPYLTPVPYRGRRNESSYIPFIAAKVAELKGITIEEVAEVTTSNARNLFGI